MATTLEAVTSTTAVVPFVRPEIVQVVAGGVAVQNRPVGKSSALYEVIADPPLSVGAVQLTMTAPLAPATLTAVGGPGVPAAVAVTLAASPSPALFDAATLIVYWTPTVRLDNTHCVATALPTQVWPPG